MKYITLNQILFAGVITLLTILFRYVLSYYLSIEEFSLIWLIAVLYGIVLFTSGWVFGKRDYESLPISDVGFRFHLTTYLVCNGIAELWFLFNLQSKGEDIKIVHLTALFWGILLALHFILYILFRKHTIKGIDKTEIFD